MSPAVSEGLPEDGSHQDAGGGEDPVTMTHARTVSFDTTVAGSESKTGIVVPDDAIERLGAGHRPPVVVELNGHSYRSTVAVMGGRHMVGVNASVREATGLRAGDAVTVALSLATTPREVDMPRELLDALAGDAEARTFFDSLSNSLQRYHADLVRTAKTDDTRRRRAEKALALFREGRKR